MLVLFQRLRLFLNKAIRRQIVILYLNPLKDELQVIERERRH